MKLLMMDSRLTVIKKKIDAIQVLQSIRKQGVSLTFRTGRFTEATFRPIKDSTDFNIWEPDTSMEIDIVFQPSIQMSQADAMEKLWRLRKHYNRHWRD
jgi:hypothetical protein